MTTTLSNLRNPNSEPDPKENALRHARMNVVLTDLHCMESLLKEEMILGPNLKKLLDLNPSHISGRVYRYYAEEYGMTRGQYDQAVEDLVRGGDVEFVGQMVLELRKRTEEGTSSDE